MSLMLRRTPLPRVPQRGGERKGNRAPELWGNGQRSTRPARIRSAAVEPSGQRSDNEFDLEQRRRPEIHNPQALLPLRLKHLDSNSGWPLASGRGDGPVPSCVRTKLEATPALLLRPAETHERNTRVEREPDMATDDTHKFRCRESERAA